MKHYIKNYIEYIKEHSNSYDVHITEVIKELMNVIEKISIENSNSYTKIYTMELDGDPLTYDLELLVSMNPNPDFNTDDHFSSMEWEEINFKKNGFCMDANVYMDSDEDVVPEVEIVLLIDPNRASDCYDKIFLKLNDIISHELNHLTQIGWNRTSFSMGASPQHVRDNAKTGYKYFLLPDEIDSMVKGMYRSSKIEGIPIDKAFETYLDTFLEHGYLNRQEYSEVIEKWIEYALIHYPKAVISKKYIK
jgi:hypothetical protein